MSNTMASSNKMRYVLKYNRIYLSDRDDRADRIHFQGLLHIHPWKNTARALSARSTLKGEELCAFSADGIGVGYLSFYSLDKNDTVKRSINIIFRSTSLHFVPSLGTKAPEVQNTSLHTFFSEPDATLEIDLIHIQVEEHHSPLTKTVSVFGQT